MRKQVASRLNYLNYILIIVILILTTSCEQEGCTNPSADNYDAKATKDDGSCIIPGCTDPKANNYNSKATYNDGSCIYPYGEAVFWTDKDYGVGQIEVYVSSSYVGKITRYYTSTPDCNANGCVTIKREPGTYTFSAFAVNDETTWGGTITISSGKCYKARLIVTKEGEAFHTIDDFVQHDDITKAKDIPLKDFD